MHEQRRLAEVIGDAEALAAQWSRACGDSGLDVSASLPIVELLIDAMSADDVDLDWRDLLKSGTIPVPTVEQLRQLRGLLFHRASASGTRGLRRHLDLFLDDLTDKVVEHQLDLVEREALTDVLTGVGNRRSFERELERELLRRARRDEALAVIMIDLDGLKAINDEIGHDAGDDTLRELARAFRSSARVTDTIFRIGGDEFVALLPDTGVTGAESIVRRAAEHAPPFSYGIAIAPTDGVSAAELLQAADALLLHRKRQRYEQQPDLAPPTDIMTEVIDITAEEAAPRAATGTAVGFGDRRLDREPVVLRHITTKWQGLRFAVDVALSRGEQHECRTSTSSGIAVARYRAVAEATLDCLVALGIISPETFVDRADLSRFSDVEVAAACVVSPSDSGAPRVSVGIATLQQGEMEGLVSAVIDAVVRQSSDLQHGVGVLGAHASINSP